MPPIRLGILRLDRIRGVNSAVLSRSLEHGMEVMRAVAVGIGGMGPRHSHITVRRCLFCVKRLAIGPEMLVPGTFARLRVKWMGIDGQKQSGEKGQYLAHPQRPSPYAVD